MKKGLLLVAILILTQFNTLFAQTLFNAPDTVCIDQNITLTSNVFDGSSYYWGFCSGYLLDAPTGANIGTSYQFNGPGNIDVIQDKDGNYYGFVVNTNTTEFLRLNYGANLTNTPTVTNFGNMTNVLPLNPTSLFIVKDSVDSNWSIFVSGGLTQATSTLARIDFGQHLSNPAPNIANFGNLGGVFNSPRGIFIAKDSASEQWFGYVVNYNTSELVQLDFSFNLSTTPLVFNEGNVGGVLSNPTDMAGARDGGNWYFFVTNFANSTLARIDLGPRIDTLNPVGNNLGNFDFRIDSPSAITLTRDCGNYYAFITDQTTNQLISIIMSTLEGPYRGVDYNNVGAENAPTGISRILRYYDNLYGFIANSGDNSLTMIQFDQCHNASPVAYNGITPPPYFYDTPGVYNVYFVVDEGLPTMKVDCKAITVLPIPTIYQTSDTTLCEGDTIQLHVISDLADSFFWTNNYNIDTMHDSVKVWPDYSTAYPVQVYYPDGCIVDTTIKIHVSKVKADAGPDRTIGDGAYTILGGPQTTRSPEDGNYSYYWFPFQFLSDTTATDPSANPPYDFTYYFKVTELNDAYGCSDIDTVVVHVGCEDFAIPNAFAPGSNNIGTQRFGILNKEIAKLNYFRIYDRWGVLVFETTDPTQKWDGRYNNKPAPADVYVWEADGFCISGKKITKAGNVTLIR